MGLENATNRELLRVLDLKVEGCPLEGCLTCKANEELLHELAKRLGIPEYKTIKQERTQRIMEESGALEPVKKTPEEIKRMRDTCLEDLKSLGIVPKEITCDRCKSNDVCEWAYDAYNTDGDCLACK
jgi:MoaA/NifB/PqqE/SkfB family radical SAM enzyme